MYCKYRYLEISFHRVVSAYENVAGSGTPSQTDDKETYSTADKAIDGNTDGVWKIGKENSISVWNL